MSIPSEPQGSLDRFFPPAQEDTGAQPAAGPTRASDPLQRFAEESGGPQQRGSRPRESPQEWQYAQEWQNDRPSPPPEQSPQRWGVEPSTPPAQPQRSYSGPPVAAEPPLAEPAQPAGPPPQQQQTYDQAPAAAQRWGVQPSAPAAAPEQYSGQPAQPGQEITQPVQPAQPVQPVQPAQPAAHVPWTPETALAQYARTQQSAQPAAQPVREPWAEEQTQATPVRNQAMPDWMDEPLDPRYVDERVGDDEQSLTYNADRLDLVGKRKLPPGRGWRKWLYWMTFRSLNLGLSPAEVAYAEMVEAIRQPIRGDYKIGVVSLKGGVGKTTTTVTLGSVFAQLRKGDRVVALDGNPDFGNLVSRVPRQTNTTVKDLLADGDLSRYGDVRHHTSQNSHGLEVVAGERDLAQSERFSKSEYERVMAVLQRHYSLLFTDCGTGLINEAMAGVLDTANSLILVSSMTVDGARAASANIEWLLIHGHQHLVERAVVILNTNKQGKGGANVDQLKKHFSPYVRAVHVIPFDDHLAEGGEVNLELLDKATKRSFEELAELIASDFPSATGRHRTLA